MSSPFLHAAAVSAVHNQQTAVKRSEAWPYAEVQVVDPSESKAKKEEVTTKPSNEAPKADPVQPVTPCKMEIISKDVAKLLLFTAAACGAVLLLDISAKVFIARSKK
jgi:hypothetical protein